MSLLITCFSVRLYNPQWATAWHDKDGRSGSTEFEQSPREAEALVWQGGPPQRVHSWRPCWFYYQLLLASFWPNGKVPIQCWSVWAIKSMRSISAMPTLENRSLYLKLCTLYKIIYGCFYFHPMFLYLSQVEFFTIVPPISLTSCPHQLFAFVSSTISIRPWNTLLVCCWVLHKLQSFWL